MKWENISSHRNSAIQCETPSALVSSGKKYVISFTYTPTSVKTLEQLYQFSIPGYNLGLNFLIVGKIMPH